MITTTSTFQQTRYMVRRKIFKIFGGAFHIYSPEGNVLAYSKMKAFKLKEDIRIYTGEDMAHELLVIQARQIIDFSAAYDVFDPVAGVKVGALRRKGLKSALIRDEWMILDPSDQQIGLVHEDSTGMAVLRRYVPFMALIFPQSYSVEIAGRPAAIFKQNFNPFVYKLNVDLSYDEQGLLDRRLAMAAAVLLAAIEGKQQNN